MVGGVVKCITEMVKVAEKHPNIKEITISSREENLYYDGAQVNNFIVHHIEMGKLKRVIFFVHNLLECWKIFKRIQPGSIVILEKNIYVSLSLFLYPLLKKINCNLIYHHHGSYAEYFRRYSWVKAFWFRLSERIMIDKVLYLFDNGEKIDQKFFHLPNFVHSGDKTRDKQYNNKINILYCGRLSSKKGIYDFIEICKGLNEKDPHKFAFTIVGDGSDNIKSLVSETIKQYANIYYAGATSNPDKFYKQSDILISPSYYDGFGLTTIEAMSYGVPVLSYRTSGAELLINNHVNGFIIETGNVTAMVDLVTLIVNKNLLPELARNCRIVNSKYSFKKFEKNLNQLLENPKC